MLWRLEQRRGARRHRIPVREGMENDLVVLLEEHVDAMQDAFTGVCRGSIGRLDYLAHRFALQRELVRAKRELGFADHEPWSRDPRVLRLAWDRMSLSEQRAAISLELRGASIQREQRHSVFDPSRIEPSWWYDLPRSSDSLPSELSVARRGAVPRPMSLPTP